MIAVVSPSITSTSGRASVGMKPCTKALYVSLISRCDSAAIVSNTSELLPEPETPVNTVRRRFGIATLTSLRLFSRAPSTRIRSCASATCSGPERVSVRVDMTSVHLLDADEVARGIAEGAVPHPPRLLGRLLDDFGAACLHLLERAVEIGRGEQNPAVGALRHHLGDRAAFVVGDARIGGRRREQDRRAGLVWVTDRDPAHLALADVVADLEAEHVAIEGEGLLRVVVREERGVNGDIHGGHDRRGSRAGASRFLIGLDTCFARHGGIPAVTRAPSRR